MKKEVMTQRHHSTPPSLLGVEKVNPWSIGTEEEATDPNLNQDYWVGYDDSCLVVSTGIHPDGPKVWLTDQMLVWLAIEGLCRLRDHYDKLDAEIEKMKAEGLIPCTCVGPPPTPADQEAIKAMAETVNERCKCGPGFHPPSEPETKPIGSVCKCQHGKLGVVTATHGSLHKGIKFDGTPWESRNPQLIAKTLAEYVDDSQL